MKLAQLSLSLLASTVAAASMAQITPHARVNSNGGPATVLPQTWVSGLGSDANPCTRSSPCATFAAALLLTSPGGEIDALDAGDFGSVTIDHSIIINGAGAQISAASTSNASSPITIAAGANDTVTIRNLDLSGLGQSTGNVNGISITSAKLVHIENVRVSNFTGSGIGIQATSSIIVTVNDSTSSDNLAGIAASTSSGTALVLVTRSHFAQENIGIFAAAGSKFLVSDSDVVRGQVGFESVNSSLDLVRSKAVDESTAGIKADANGVIRLSEVTVANNTRSASETGNGAVISFGNNALTGAVVITANIPLR